MKLSRRELVELVTRGAIALVIKLATSMAAAVVAHGTGAVLLRDDAVHNAADVVVIAGAWTAWLVARRPPTAAHRWGLGRVEDVAQLIVGLAIGVTGLYVLSEARERASEGSPRPENLVAVVLMAGVAAAAYYAAAKLQHHAGRRTGSAALSALGDDARADMLVSILVGTGALLRGLGAPAWIDVALGGVIGFLILKLAWSTIVPALRRLTDRQDFKLVEQVTALLGRPDGFVAVDDVRARRLGSICADVDVVVHVMPWAPDATRIQEQILNGLARSGLRATVSVQLRVQPQSPWWGPTPANN